MGTGGSVVTSGGSVVGGQMYCHYIALLMKVERPG